MANLSTAIIEARKRHEAEIAERLKRRQMRQRAEIERLNASVIEGPAVQTAAQPGSTSPTRERASETSDEPARVEQTIEPATTSAVAEARAHVASEPFDLAPAPTELERAADWQAPIDRMVQVATASPSPRVEPRGEPRSELEVAPPTQRYESAPPLTEPPPVLVPPPRIVASPYPADEVETLPDARFLRLRNEIIDRIKPFLTGNQFAVYMEIYRQTVGRGKTSAWFRTRDIQTACNLGSDNTVRDAYPVLEQKRLIRLDPNRRAGSPKGLLVTVLSVDRALERLERSQSPTPRSGGFGRASASDFDDLDAAGVDDPMIRLMTRQYGVSPTVAPHLLELVRPEDRGLLPYLFARLDRSLASGKVHNPGGLLRVWLESFETWRAELEAERRRDEEARQLEYQSASRDELMLDWYKQSEVLVAERVASLDAAVLHAMKERGRAELLSRSPAVRTWTDAQWETQLDTFVKAEIRRELESFDAWLRRTGRS